MENKKVKAKAIAFQIAKVLDNYNHRQPQKTADGYSIVTDDDNSVITVFNDAERLIIQFVKGTIPAVAAQQALEVERRWGDKIKVIVSDNPYDDVTWDEIIPIEHFTG